MMVIGDVSGFPITKDFAMSAEFCTFAVQPVKAR